MQKHKGALPAWRLRALISRRQSPSNFYLLYGPDIGQNLELSTLLFNHIKNNTLIRINGSDCKDNPSIILQHMRQDELFNSNTKVISIFQAETAPIYSFKSIAKELESFTGIIIARSENLSPKNELRKWANLNGATIACYPLSGRNLNIYVNDLIRSNAKTISPAVLKFIISLIEGNDTAIINNEINKLILFIGDKKQISLTDVQECLSFGAVKNLDEIIDLILTKNPAKVVSTITLLTSLNENITLILRVLLRTWSQIKDIHAYMEDGASLEKAIDSLYPAVFFRTKNTYMKCVNRFNTTEINYFLQQTLKAEAGLRQNSMPKMLLLRNLIVSIAVFSQQPKQLPIAI